MRCNRVGERWKEAGATRLARKRKSSRSFPAHNATLFAGDGWKQSTFLSSIAVSLRRTVLRILLFERSNNEEEL